MKLDDLKQFFDKTIVVQMTDGERATVKIRSVDEEYADLIVDVLETSAPEHYKDRSAAYTFAALEITSAETGEGSVNITITNGRTALWRIERQQHSRSCTGT